MLLPEYIYSIVSCYCQELECFEALKNYFGKQYIIEVVDDSTYVNGVLHSINDKCAKKTPGLRPLTFSKEEWYRFGKLHRDNDLPAVCFADGTRDWYQFGQRHRDEDKPAIEDSFGCKEWYKFGKLHRDGHKPAVTYKSSVTYDEFYRNGYKYNPLIDKKVQTLIKRFWT